MSLKGRTKFTVAGAHPLLYRLRDYLILKGLALVPWSDEPHFCLYGVEASECVDISRAAKAITELEVVRKYPTVLLGNRDPRDPEQWKASAYRVSLETAATLAPSPLVALRVSDVYGWPGDDSSPLATYLALKQEDVPPTLSPGVLHWDDFVNFMRLLIADLLKRPERYSQAQRSFVLSGAPYKQAYLRHALQPLVSPDIPKPESWPYLSGMSEAATSLEYLKKEFGWEPTTPVKQGLWRLRDE